jgi:hypothetical protein
MKNLIVFLCSVFLLCGCGSPYSTSDRGLGDGDGDLGGAGVGDGDGDPGDGDGDGDVPGTGGRVGGAGGVVTSSGGGEGVALPDECKDAVYWEPWSHDSGVALGLFTRDSIVFYDGSFWVFADPEAITLEDRDMHFPPECVPGEEADNCWDFGMVFVKYDACPNIDVPLECSGAKYWHARTYFNPQAYQGTPFWHKGKFWVTAAPEQIPNGFEILHWDCPPDLDFIPGVAPDRCFTQGNTWVEGCTLQ